MYKITCDGVKIYDTTSMEDSLKLTGPTLTLSDNSAGSLEFSCAPNTIAYSKCSMLTSTISVFRDGVEIWRGRPLTSKEDFWKCRSFYCEGAMSFLVDTVLPSDIDFEGGTNVRDGKIRTTVSNFIDLILDNHNSKIREDRKIYKGVCSVTNRNNVANFEYEADNSLNVLANRVISVFGGHSRIRISGGRLYFDYFGDEYADPEYGMGTAITNSQYIEFGKNLLDFTKNYDYTNIATVYFPIGPKLKSKDADGNEIELDERMTIEEATIESGQNGIRKEGVKYLAVNGLYDKYGRIEAKLDISDAETPQQLLEMALDAISSTKFNDLTINVSLVDLHNLDTNIQEYNLLDTVRCLSTPHGLNKVFLITDLKITLDNPAGDTITLNGKGDTSLTSRTVSGLGDVIKKLPKPSSILEQAKINAKKLINMCTSGYVTFLKDGDHVYAMSITGAPITKREDLQSLPSYWLWNQNGLGYFSNGETKAAITMEGEIVADFITTGFMHADRIRGGELTLGGFDNVNGLLKIKNVDGDTIGVWNQDGIGAIAGSIGGWNISNNKIWAKNDTNRYIVLQGWETNVGGDTADSSLESKMFFDKFAGTSNGMEELIPLTKFPCSNYGVTKVIEGFVGSNIIGLYCSQYDMQMRPLAYTRSYKNDSIYSPFYYGKILFIETFNNKITVKTDEGQNVNTFSTVVAIAPLSFKEPFFVHPCQEYPNGLFYLYDNDVKSKVYKLTGEFSFKGKKSKFLKIRTEIFKGDTIKFYSEIFITPEADFSSTKTLYGFGISVVVWFDDDIREAISNINQDNLFMSYSFPVFGYVDFSRDQNGKVVDYGDKLLQNDNKLVVGWHNRNGYISDITRNLEYNTIKHENWFDILNSKRIYCVQDDLLLYDLKSAFFKSIDVNNLNGDKDVMMISEQDRQKNTPGIYVGAKSLDDLTGSSFIADVDGNITAINSTMKGTSITGDKSTHAMELSNGRIQGYFNGEMTTYISSNSTITIDDGPSIPSMRIVSKGGIAFYIRNLLMNKKDLPDLGTDGFGALGGTGSINVVTNVWMENGELKVSYKTLNFVNGIMTTAL